MSTRQYKKIIKSIQLSDNLKILLVMFLFHFNLFLILLILALIIFQSDLYSLWSGSNDSWRFIANTLNPVPPPYPYHPIATSLHYLVMYLIISMLIPSNLALILSIFIIQFSFSLATLYLLYDFLIESFHLESRCSLALVVFYDFIIISPYLLLATSEILFLFYQLLAWACFIRKQYFFTAIATAMVFALRFNGAFFVIGVLLVFFLKWVNKRDFSPKLLASICITGVLMFLIGFSSFILSWLFRGDFWLPLTFQNIKYQTVLEYAANGAFSFPFLWWITYFQYVILSNSPIEIAFLSLALIALGLGISSLYALLRWSKDEDTGDSYSLLLIFICGFLGVNIIISGSNFSRFLSYTFPVYSVFPLWLKEQKISFSTLFLLAVGAGIWCLFFNIIWWLTYPS